MFALCFYGGIYYKALQQYFARALELFYCVMWDQREVTADGKLELQLTTQVTLCNMCTL